MTTEYLENLESISTVINVPHKVENIMTVRFTVIGTGEADLATSIQPRAIGKDDKSLQIHPRAVRTSDKPTVVTSIHSGDSDIYTEIQPMGFEEMPAVIEIRPNARMQAIYEVKKPPILSETHFAAQDAFTKKEAGYQAINYGRSSSMMIVNNDENESWVKFNLKKLDNQFIITNVFLELTYYKGFKDNYRINMYHAAREWSEEGITYLNKPKRGQFISNTYEANKKQEKILFDVTEAATSWLRDPVTNNGIMLTTPETESLYIRARESQTPPRLIVQYYNSKLPSTGRSQVNTELFVCHADQLEASVVVEVGSTFEHIESDLQLYVHRPEVPLTEDSYMEVTAIKTNAVTAITVVRSDEMDVPTLVSARSELQYRDKNTALDVSRNEASLEIIARQVATDETTLVLYPSRNESFVEIKSRQEDISEALTIIEANDIHVRETEAVIIARTEDESAINTEIFAIMAEENNTPTVIEARIEEVSENNLSVYVSKGDVLTSIKVMTQDNADVNTSIYARTEGEIETVSTVIVNRKGSATEITVKILDIDEVNTTIFVWAKEDNDKNTIINTSRKEVLTEITAVSIDYVSTEAVISPRAIDENHVLTTIQASREEISMEITAAPIEAESNPMLVAVRAISDNNISTVIQPSREETLTQISAAINEESVIATEISVIYSGESDCSSKLLISREETLTEIIVREKEDNEILTIVSASVCDKSNLSTELFIPYESIAYTTIDAIGASRVDTYLLVSQENVKSTILVPYRENSDISTQISPRILFVGDLPTLITVGKAPKGYTYFF